MLFHATYPPILPRNRRPRSLRPPRASDPVSSHPTPTNAPIPYPLRRGTSMTAPEVPATSPDPSPPLLWGTDSLRDGIPQEMPWLWHGYLASGALTLLTSQW